MLFTFFFLFFAIFQINVSMGTEPVCSKFSYEEKLLEKMIRTEIRVETMQNEIKKTEENVLNTLLEIKKTASDLYDKFENFKNNMTGEINTQMNELQKGEEHFASKFEEMKKEVSKKLEKEMDNLAKIKEKMLQPTVAFHTHNVKDLILDQAKEVLVFQNIITNEGSGYDKSTGIFTAPVGGVYHFIVHVCADNKKYSTIGLMLDGTFVAKSVQHNTNVWACGSVGAVVTMTSGKQVWVSSTGGDPNHVLRREHIIYSMNTFSGVLISQ